MANEKRVRNNNVQGTLSSTMNSTGTTMNSAGLANLEAISSTEHAAIIIDPGRTAGAPEIVHVTAHTGSATSATVVRGREGTAARAHSSTEVWVHAPTATVDFLPFRPPSVKAHRDAAQSINTATWTAINFDTQEWDTDSIWSSTDAERFNINTPGKYLINMRGAFASSTGGTLRVVGISKNSTTSTGIIANNQIPRDQLAGTVYGQILEILDLSTSDFICGMMFQNSGSSLNTSTAEDAKPRLSLIWQSS